MKLWMASACLAMFSFTLVAEVPSEGADTVLLPDGYADRICDAPQNLTGSIQVGLWSMAANYYPSIVWDGAAYGIAWSDVNSEIYFARVAADGTPLVPATRITNDPAGSNSPSIAWSGTEYGVAWYDSRTTVSDIYFARISATGTKIGSDVQITSDLAASYYPSLAWTGTEYGVAWQDSRSAGYDLYFARISAAGVKIGADVQITSDAASSYVPSLAWKGNEFGVAWHDNRSTGFDIYFARISAAGVKIGGDVQVTNDAGTSFNPCLAWTGSIFGVAWSDDRTTGGDIYFARLSPSGTKIGADVPLTSNTGYDAIPRLTWSGSEFGLSFMSNASGRSEIGFQRVSSGGANVGAEVAISTDGTSPGYSALAFGTKGYGVAYIGNGTLKFVGLGCHNDTTPPTCPSGLAIATNNALGVTLGWVVDGTDPETEIAYHRVYRDGAVLGVTTDHTFTDSPRPSGTPSYAVTAVHAGGGESVGCAVVTAPAPTSECGAPWSTDSLISSGLPFGAYGRWSAWDGSAYGVVWMDNRGGNYEIYFARVGADGTVLVPASRITNNAGLSAYPSLAWTGTEYGVAWQDSRTTSGDIYFARISTGGVKIGADVQITNDAASSYIPSLAWTGSEYGVAWHDNRSTALDIYFARISAAGTKIGADVQITSDPASSVSASLAWTGSEFGVAWQDSRSTAGDIYFARISAAGTKVGGDVQITNDAGITLAPSLAWTGSEYGVAWQDSRSTGYDIYFARISAAGSKVGSDVQVTSAASTQRNPLLVWTGAEYLLAWEDFRSGSISEIYGATLTPSGVSQVERPFEQGSLPAEAPTLALGGHGAGLAYTFNSGQVRFVGLGCGAFDSTPPSCPASPAETARTSSSVTLGWGPSLDAESDLAHYDIFKDGVYSGLTTATTWTDSAFDPAAGPVYTISATNAAALTSPACASVDTADLAPPTCPENLLASGVTQTSARLDWLPAQDAKSGLKQYKVYRNDLFLANVAAGTTTYTDATLASGTTYNFAVRAEDWAGNYSTTCTAASVYIATSPIALFITKNADGRNADLDWNNVGLNEYVVYRSTSAQAASELKRVPSDQTKDEVLQDGVPLWFYYIQQRE